MEEFFAHLSLGFSIAATPENIFYCFVGALLGTVIGVLPGLGPITAIAVLLPITYDMNPTTAVIMICGMYYGATYGGSTSSVLVNAPGEASSAITCLEGFQMAKQGRAKAALATAAIGSFVGGTFATGALMVVSPLVASLAIRFAPPEYVALMLLALTMVSGLSSGSFIKGMLSTTVGLLLSMVGIDTQTGATRFIFGIPEMMEGIDFIVVAIGLFAISEVLMAAASFKQVTYEVLQVKGRYWITLSELKQSIPAYLRGTILGFAVGALPGGGGTISSFMSYALEKRFSRRPEEFGKGAIEGVAGPETANNAAHQAQLVPLMTLGIPTSGVGALLLGAFQVYGLQPGPLLFEKNPDFVWGLFASMYIGNAILLILNLPLVNIFTKLLDLPGSILYSMVIAFCVLGVYGIRLAIFDVGVMLVFGIMGYFMRRHGYPLAPCLLGLVLGELLEQSFRRALTLSAGNPMIFLTRPITVALLVLTLIVVLAPLLWGSVKSARARAMAEATTNDA